MDSAFPQALRWTLTEAQQAAVDVLLDRAVREQVPDRLWARDATLWGPAGQPEVADRLGWLDAPARAREQHASLAVLAASVVADGYTDVVLVGMGGSSLAPEVIGTAGGITPLRLRMLDSTDPDAIATVDAATDPDRTLVLVSTKSGNTLETLSLFRHFWDRRPDGSAFVAVTDPGSALEALAREHDFRAVVCGDPEIGGRYSALSPFGVLPATLIGVDVDALIRGGLDGLDASRGPVADNAAVRLGVAIAALADGGRNKLALRVQNPTLGYFALWMEQLVAESTGKHGRGVLPLVDDPGADSSSLRTLARDRQLLVLRGTHEDRELDAEILESTQAGVPVLELFVDEGRPEAPMTHLGFAFATTEVAVAVAGWGLGINPFDQPDVQAAKDATRAVLADVAEGIPIEQAPDADADAILAFIAGLAAPDYLALLAYVPPSLQGSAVLGQLRRVLSARTDAAISTGFGPRYLHSTGQLHKGGPPGGRFLILEHDPRAIRPVPSGAPDLPASSFDTLIRAQAVADQRTLAAHDRAVVRLTLGVDWLERLEEIVQEIEERNA